MLLFLIVGIVLLIVAHGFLHLLGIILTVAGAVTVLFCIVWMLVLGRAVTKGLLSGFKR